MIETLSKGLEGYFDKRWLLVYLFPILLFICLGSWIAAPEAVTHLMHAVDHLGAESKILVAIGFLSLVIVVAASVSLQIGSILRLMEGYWFGGSLEKGKRAYYQATIVYLNQRQAFLNATVDQNVFNAELAKINARLYFDFPPADRAMPTLLGNVLRASEDYPRSRYGADSVLLWPRMLGVLPDEFLERLQDARSSLDLMSLLAILFVLFIPLSLVRVATLDMSLASMLVPLGSLFGAWMAYGAAVAAARSYGELIRAAFDQHRADLQKSLGILPGDDFIQESQIWQETAKQIFDGFPLTSTRYRPGDDPPSPPSAEKVVRLLFGDAPATVGSSAASAPAGAPGTPPAGSPVTIPTPEPLKPSVRNPLARWPLWVGAAIVVGWSFAWLFCAPIPMEESHVIVSLPAGPELTHGFKLTSGEQVTLVCVSKVGDVERFESVQVEDPGSTTSKFVSLRMKSSEAEALLRASASGRVSILKPAP